MKLSKLSTLAAAMFLGFGFAYAQDDALPTETVNIMMDKYGYAAKYKGTDHTEFYMTFISYSERSSRVTDKKSADYALYGEYIPLVNDYIYEVYLDIWADLRNQNGKKSFLEAGTYAVSDSYDVAGTIYGNCSFIRQYDSMGNWVQDIGFPSTITIVEDSGNKYHFTIETTDGTTNYKFVFGVEDGQGIENLKWGNHPNDPDGNGIVDDMTFEEYLNSEDDPNDPTFGPGSAPAHPTGIETVDGDVAQISFDGNTISLGATADAIVVDASGRVCLHTVASSIDVSNLASGLYIVKAGNQVLKFLKK